MNLASLGYDANFEFCFHAYLNEIVGHSAARAGIATPIVARVAREDRESYIVYTDGRALRAGVRGSLRHRAASRADYPAVGDWVVVTPRAAESAATIQAILPRRSHVTRKAAGPRAAPQVIAANVDRLLICCGLDHDFNLRRIERYVTLAYAGGATPVVVLTKADCAPNAADRRAAVEALCIGVTCIECSIVDDRGIAELRATIAPGSTAALVGSSGVGKSSLINRFVNEARLAVGAVREHDSRGRHTTTARQLLLLPGGGVIIDTPGMRELQAWADASDVDAAFGEIESLAASCRFRDCAHRGEPGCAVLAAIDSGELPRERLSSYHKQRREMEHLDRKDDPALAAEHKARWKAIHKAAQKHMKQKYRF
ncbi:MAG: ribosome small subunit-dependent GTPase A [Phycisphaerae bacterium]